MSSAQDFLDKLRTGRVETKSAAESIDPWVRLHAALENGNANQSAYEKAVENPSPTLGNATPLKAPAVSIHKAMLQQTMRQNQPQPAEPDAPAPEQLENYEERIDRIFNSRNFGWMVAPAIRNSIRKALKEQLPGLDYKDPEFIKKFEEINGKVEKAAAETASEYEGILGEYKAIVKNLAGIKESGVLAEE
jgi:hypothetical protein